MTRGGGRGVILIARSIPSRLGARGKIAPTERPRQRGRRAVAGARVFLLALAPRALELSAGRRNGQKELPAALRRIRGRTPHDVAGEHTETESLLRAALVASVCRVRDNVILMVGELLLAEEAG